MELFRFAAANGFLLAAAVGLVKSSLSSYPRLRREAGFLQFDEAEMLRQLEQAGFVAERHYPNIGHNTARMTFVATAPNGRAWRDRDSRHRGSTADGQGAEQGVGQAWKSGPKDYRLAACMFAAVWLLLSFPWLSGAATIPYDAKALFQAQLQFLANALHSGQSPFWNPSAFVGVPQIADPQSLIFSPAILLAWLREGAELRASGRLCAGAARAWAGLPY